LIRRYQFIDKYQKHFGLNWLFKRLEVYPNGYYNYKKNRRSSALDKKAKALDSIKRIYHAHNGTPGYRMIKIYLEQEGISLSTTTVHKYMKELGLKSVVRRRKPNYKYHKPYMVFDNLLEQCFDAKARNSVWCTDFTYLKMRDGSFRYNCTILDLYDRRVVASCCGRKMDTTLAIKTLKKAMIQLDGEEQIVLHSDRGSQFTSREFTDFCAETGVIQSMSKPGCPYDNAVMERYFNSLKNECVYLYSYQDEEKLFNDIAEYAYGWDNNDRPHSHNNGLPPAKVSNW